MIGSFQPATADHKAALETAIELLRVEAEKAEAEASSNYAYASAASAGYARGRARGLRDAVSRLTCLMNEGH